MKISKPKFWDQKKSLISLFLFPISFLFQIFLKIRKITTNQKSFNTPIICVGNIYLGGTGKTPLTIEIAKELEILGKKPAIIKKFYPDHFDEHSLIRNQVKSLFLDKSRIKAISKADSNSFDFLILDDGFQDHSFKKDLNILCFNSNQLLGNEMTLPSGPLRESLDAIKKSDIILINGRRNKSFENKILGISEKIKIFYSKYILHEADKFENKNVLAFAGIGNPDNFFELLENNNVNIKKKLIFPDHYNYNKVEINKIMEDSLKDDLKVVTTEKDYLRIKDYGHKNLIVAKVKLIIENKDNFINEIMNINAKKN